MKILIVNHQEVGQYLPMQECMDVITDALKKLGEGRAQNPLRSGMWLPDHRGLLGMMPGSLEDPDVMGMKALSVFPGNHDTEYDSHQGLVIIFETKTGQPLAMMDASKITATRTAAMSGVATRLLAKEDAGDLTILGSGIQAGTHLEAMLLARNITRIRVWSRNQLHAEKFAERESKQHGVNVEPVSTAKSAVEGCDIICTTTFASEPILMGDWLAPGVHINAVGSSVASARELDTATVVKSRLFVDRRESAVNEAGDFLIPQKEGAIDEAHIQGEIGEILLNQISGRKSGQEITLFKSLGLAVEDVASAYHIYQKLNKSCKGTWVDFGGKKSV